MPAFIDRTGDRYGRLLVMGRARSRSRRVAWLCRCDCGTEVEVRGDLLIRGNTRSCGCLQRERTSKAVVTYLGAHQRVYRARGKASAYACVDCEGPASEWSYDHTDPDEQTEERVDQKGRPNTVAYSAKPEHFSPRCKGCHTSFDMGRADAAEVMG